MLYWMHLQIKDMLRRTKVRIASFSSKLNDFDESMKLDHMLMRRSFHFPRCHERTTESPSWRYLFKRRSLMGFDRPKVINTV